MTRRWRTAKKSHRRKTSKKVEGEKLPKKVEGETLQKKSKVKKLQNKSQVKNCKKLQVKNCKKKLQVKNSKTKLMIIIRIGWWWYVFKNYSPKGVNAGTIKHGDFIVPGLHLKKRLNNIICIFQCLSGGYIIHWILTWTCFTFCSVSWSSFHSAKFQAWARFWPVWPQKKLPCTIDEWTMANTINAPVQCIH